jgi:hypothetical protein
VIEKVVKIDLNLNNTLVEIPSCIKKKNYPINYSISD